MRFFRFTLLGTAIFGFALLSAAPASAQTPAKSQPDVLIFTNGDQLTGKLERAVGGNVVFKSDMAGELTISFDKIKELRSGEQFALLRKGVPPTKVRAPEGTVQLAAGEVVLTPPSAAPLNVKPADVGYLVQKAEYDKQISSRTGILHGWNGAVTAAASFVRSTQDSTQFNAAINLARVVSPVPYLPRRNRTLIDFTETYGKLTSPAIAATATPASVVKTSLYHAGAERDEYFSPRLYALGDVSFDHNYSQGLQLQQIFGGGLGWTPIQSPRQQLDLTADVHYETQEFETPSSNVNIFGSTFAEAYRRNLPHKLAFTEGGNIIPGWSDSRAYSANVNAALLMPVYKRIGATLSTTDNYLNDPSPGFKKNSYQFLAGLNYTLP